MKYIVPILLGLLLGGCTGAYFGKAEQHKKGDWYFLANSKETARIRQDQLALEKLKSQPVMTRREGGVVEGYKGMIANMSSYNRYNFKIIGPETKSIVLGPGERYEDCLIPGEYIAIVYQGGRKVGEHEFTVSSQINTFLNEKVHWFVYAER